MTIDNIMALAASCYSRIDPEPQWKLRQAIEQALLQAHKEGFDAALLPGSVPDAHPRMKSLADSIHNELLAARQQHITDGSPCWCSPDLDYVDPETGAKVWIHKESQ